MWYTYIDTGPLHVYKGTPEWEKAYQLWLSHAKETADWKLVSINANCFLGPFPGE